MQSRDGVDMADKGKLKSQQPNSGQDFSGRVSFISAG